MKPQHELTIRSLDGKEWGLVRASCPVCGEQTFHTAYAAFEWHGRRTNNIPNVGAFSFCRGPART